MQFGGNIFLGFADEDQNKQGRQDHQPAAEEEGIAGVDPIEGAADECCQDGAQSTHQVDDPIGCGSIARRGDVRHEGHHRGAPESHRQQEGDAAKYEQRQNLCKGNDAKHGGCHRCADDNEGQSPANGRAQAV